MQNCPIIQFSRMQLAFAKDSSLCNLVVDHISNYVYSPESYFWFLASSFSLCHINFCENRKRGFRTAKKLLKCQTKKFRCRKRGHSNKLFLQEHISVLTQYCSSSTFLWNMEPTREMEAQFYPQLIITLHLKAWILLFCRVVQKPNFLSN